MLNREIVKIETLVDGAKSVNVQAKIVEIQESREVTSKRTGETFNVADATIADETGIITLVLWNEQIAQFEVGDNIKIEYGYVKKFKDTLQLNVGKYGKIIKDSDTK